MRCDTCGNDFDKPLEITYLGKRHTFDSFECAIAKLAPRCGHCGCRIIGHGVEAEGVAYCCSHCAREVGHEAMSDSA